MRRNRGERVAPRLFHAHEASRMLANYIMCVQDRFAETIVIDERQGNPDPAAAPSV